ncbi:hypothetical protein [Sulfodiicoccus acidiphilus]|nr:hypothetical protein [Sulfodiicoccus acidiphilus]
MPKKAEVVAFLAVLIVILLSVRNTLFTHINEGFIAYWPNVLTGPEVRYAIEPIVGYNPLSGVTGGANWGLYVYWSFLYLLYLAGVKGVPLLNQVQVGLVMGAQLLGLWYLAEQALRTFHVELSYVKRIAFKSSASLLFFLNPLVMVTNSSFFDFNFGNLLLIYVLLKIFSSVETKLTWKDFTKMGLALGVSFTMDPRYGVWDPLVMLLVYLGLVAVGKLKPLTGFKDVIYPLLVSVPFVVVTYFTYVYGSSSISAPFLRVSNLGTIGFFSANASFLYLLMSLGSWWPSVLFAPLNILWTKQFQYVGYNGVLIFTSTPWNAALISLLFMFYALAFAAVLTRRFRHVTVPLWLANAFFLAYEAGTNFPVRAFTYWVEEAPRLIPVMGGIFSTTSALPYFAAYAVGVALITLLTWVTLYELLKLEGGKWVGILALVLVAASLASWEFFDGQYFPGSPVTSGFTSPPQGIFEPVQPPQYWLNAYNYVAQRWNQTVSYALYSGWFHTWANRFIGGVVWPGVAANPNTNFSLLSDAFSQSRLLLPFFAVYGIRYPVVDDTTFFPQTGGLLAFERSHLPVAYNGSGEVLVFDVQGAHLVYGAREALRINGTQLQALDYLSELMPFTNWTPPVIVPPSYNGSGALSVTEGETVNGSVILIVNSSNSRLEVNATPGRYYVYTENVTSNTVTPLSCRVVLSSGGTLDIDAGNFTVIVSPVPLSELRSVGLNFSYYPLTSTFEVNASGTKFVTFVPFNYLTVRGGELLGMNVMGLPVIDATGSLTLTPPHAEYVEALVLGGVIFLNLLAIYAFVAILRGFKAIETKETSPHRSSNEG